MQPLINLKQFLAVLALLIIPAALLTAYFRNYDPQAGGHEHSAQAADQYGGDAAKQGQADHHSAASETQPAQPATPGEPTQAQVEASRMQLEASRAQLEASRKLLEATPDAPQPQQPTPAQPPGASPSPAKPGATPQPKAADGHAHKH